MPTEASAPLTIALFDTPEHQMTQGVELLLRIRNNSDVDASLSTKGPVIQTSLPFHDGPFDNYTVMVSAPGFRDTGDFVTADPKVHRILKLLMVPKDQRLSFAAWTDLGQSHPEICRFLGFGCDDAGAQARYAELQRDKPLALACLMNLVTAMGDIDLGGGKTPLDYFQGVAWDSGLAQDRFFGYADPALVPAVQTASREGRFQEEKDPWILHPGATLSYKQTDFDYSNVQLTFHGNDTMEIGGVACIKVEPDMDVYKDLVNHTLLELLPNLVTCGLTNPVDILTLRWLDASDDNQTPFNPGYTVV